MKTVFSFALAVLSCTCLSAQTAENAASTKEIGINFTRLLNEALNFGGNDTPLNPYLFTYKKLNDAGKGFRLGAGFKFNRTKGDDGSGNFFNESLGFGTLGIDLRLGSEQQRKLSGKWMFYYGFDYLIGIDYNQLNSTGEFGNGDVKITSSNLELGLGPALGAQFMISERVGISTEASFYLTQSFQLERVKFEDNFSDDEKNKSNSTGLNFSIPTNIFLFFRF